MKRAILLTMFVFSATGAVLGKNVDLTITNPTESTLDVSVVIKKKNGTIKQEVQLGALNPKGQTTRRIKVDDDGQFIVNAFLHNSAQVFDETKTVLKSDPDPLASTTALSIKYGSILKIETAQSLLKNLFSDMGPNVGFTPIPVNNGLQTAFGGLFVITAPTNNTTGAIHFKLTPTQFSNVIPFDTFPWPATSDTNTVDMTSSFAAAASVSIPVIAQLGLNATKETVYRLNYDMQGFGAVEKPEPAGWSYATGIANLGAENKAALCQALIDNQSANLIYINRMYVMRNGRFETKEGKRMSAGIKADGSTIVSGSIAYSFENVSSSVRNYNTSILNIEGVKLSLSRAPGGIGGAITCKAAINPATNKLSVEAFSEASPTKATFTWNLQPVGSMVISDDLFKKMASQ